MLLLRGPQTPGELRTRTERMYHFEALEDVVSTLDRLSQREPPLAAILPRQPGTKESRYTHLFSGQPEASGVSVTRAPLRQAQATLSHANLSTGSASSTTDRIDRLEEEVALLRKELSDVQQQLAAFRKQFE